jgi:hypothetical protein
MATVDNISSNQVGFRWCWEDSKGVLPSSPIWKQLEPNSFSDTGGQIKTTARNPINANRQRRKGVTVDLDVLAGFNQDMTADNMQDLLQGFFCADIREPYDTQSLSGETSDVDTVINSTSKFGMAFGDELNSGRVLVNALVLASGFTNAANNGLFKVTAVSAARATQDYTTAGNLSNGDTITIDGKVFTAQTSLTDVDGHFKVGASEALTLANFHHAINGTGGVAGTDYAASTTPHPSVTAVDDATHVVSVTAIEYGREGNSIAVSDTSSSGSWGAATLAGGTADLTVSGVLVDETPTSSARIQVVGHEFASATLNANYTAGDFPSLDRASGAFDFTTLGLIPGEWMFVGGDASANKFADSALNGFTRVRSVSATSIRLDKTQTAWDADETGTGKTIRVFFGKKLRNETGALIKRKYAQFERTLGAPDDADLSALQSQYFPGATANDATLNVPLADKLTWDLSYIPIDDEQRTADDGLKTGSRPTIQDTDGYNTSSDFSRMKIALVSGSDACPTPLFAFISELKATIGNNASALKAIGRLGAFATNIGTFQVNGTLTAYFSDIAAVAAVRNNSDVTIDMCIAKDNAGFGFDLPLVSLGDGRLAVEQDKPITLPLSMDAATAATISSSLDYTAQATFWSYLPSAAE